MLEIMGLAKDLRTDTNVVYAKASIYEYLKIVGKDFGKFEIQRAREKHKTYERLRADILMGALLPPITLAVKFDAVKKLESYLKRGELDKLKDELSKPGSVNILDGLQRTYILLDIFRNRSLFDDKAVDRVIQEQTLSLEFWIEKEMKNLIYRIIVLNAGQKPMSLTHQIDILSGFLADTLRNNIPDINILTSRGESSNNSQKAIHKDLPVYSLSAVAASYQCFLTQSPDLDKSNLVAQRMSEDSVLDLSESSLDDKLTNYMDFFKLYHKIVLKSFSNYSGRDKSWIVSDNVIQSLFAAISTFAGGIKEPWIYKAFESLAESGDEDFLGLRRFETLSTGYDTKRFNVGFITRRTLFFGFKNFIRDRGEVALADCWELATE